MLHEGTFSTQPLNLSAEKETFGGCKRISLWRDSSVEEYFTDAKQVYAL